jgi:DNA-binding XRE family transcriptional regulator
MAKRKMGKRIFREPTAEQAEKYRKIRKLIGDEWPEIREEAILLRDGQQRDLTDVVALLKTERETQGLAQADISESTGISKAAISRLESGENVNPTLNTLMRYADALGKRLSVVMSEDSTAT